MQRLEVSGAVRPLYGSLGVKRLRRHTGSLLSLQILFISRPKFSRFVIYPCLSFVKVRGQGNCRINYKCYFVLPISKHYIVIIIIIIIIIFIISFMQGIYTYIPETNYVPRECSVAAILLLLFMVLISLV